MLVDVHCHLDIEFTKNELPDIIKRAKKNNFYAIITNGTNPESNRRVIELSKKYSIVKPALGFYPTSATEATDKEIDNEIEFIRKQKPTAIGEVGIDYFKGTNPEKQKKTLKKFIELAKELNIPVIIHSRKAEEDAIKILEESKYKKVVLHCFSGNAEQTKKAADLGYMFSIPASIVKSKAFKKLVKRVDMNQILTETDAPFLSPYENIKRNEPSFIKETIKKISEIKKITPEKVEKQIYNNFIRMFKPQ